MISDTKADTERDLLSEIPQKKIMIESDYCVTVFTLLSSLDERVNFRLDTIAPSSYKV